jgi:hypothetical protein
MNEKKKTPKKTMVREHCRHHPLCLCKNGKLLFPSHCGFRQAFPSPPVLPRIANPIPAEDCVKTNT